MAYKREREKNNEKERIKDRVAEGRGDGERASVAEEASSASFAPPPVAGAPFASGINIGSRALLTSPQPQRPQRASKLTTKTTRRTQWPSSP